MSLIALGHASARMPPTDVSTGSLPAAERVRGLVSEAYERYRPHGEGEVSRVYPALAEVPPDLFGICHHTLAVMIAAGLYETSGEWLYDVGLPAKSGIRGGIVTVSPGKGGMGAFAPRLDAAGNSVRGQRTADFLSERHGMDLLISAPAR